MFICLLTIHWVPLASSYVWASAVFETHAGERKRYYEQMNDKHSFSLVTSILLKSCVLQLLYSRPMSFLWEACVSLRAYLIFLRMYKPVSQTTINMPEISAESYGSSAWGDESQTLNSALSPLCKLCNHTLREVEFSNYQKYCQEHVPGTQMGWREV